MDPNHDDKHPETDQTVDLDSAIDELEGLLNSHDEELHQAAYPEDDEEDIPVLMDVVEPPESGWQDFELAGAPPGSDAPEPLLEDPGMEREPMLPFEFMDELTPVPEPEPASPPATEFTDTIPEFELGPEPRSASMPEAEADVDTDVSAIIAAEPETQEVLMPVEEDGGGSQASSGELTPQLLDELETIIDQELQHVTAAAKQSILATLRAHLDQSGQAELDIAMGTGTSEHFPATAPDAESESGPEEDNPPLRPFAPFSDPD